MARWATFDCYGTLVDWNAGIRSELERLLGDEHGERLLARYHELEPEIQAAAPDMSYREVMATVLARLGEEEDVARADIDLERVDELRRSPDGDAYPLFVDRRPGIYETLR